MAELKISGFKFLQKAKMLFIMKINQLRHSNFS